MFSERGVAFVGRVGHLGWIFELDGRFWQRGRVRHHPDREAYTLPSDLVPSWHPKSRRFPLVARQRGRGECTWADRLGVRKLQPDRSPSSSSLSLPLVNRRVSRQSTIKSRAKYSRSLLLLFSTRQKETERISLKSRSFRTENIGDEFFPDYRFFTLPSFLPIRTDPRV